MKITAQFIGMVCTWIMILGGSYLAGGFIGLGIAMIFFGLIVNANIDLQSRKKKV